MFSCSYRLKLPGLGAMTRSSSSEAPCLVMAHAVLIKSQASETSTSKGSLVWSGPRPHTCEQDHNRCNHHNHDKEDSITVLPKRLRANFELVFTLGENLHDISRPDQSIRELAYLDGKFPALTGVRGLPLQRNFGLNWFSLLPLSSMQSMLPVTA